MFRAPVACLQPGSLMINDAGMHMLCNTVSSALQGRGKRRANALNRRTRPAMTDLVHNPVIPPPACERVEHNRNIMQESSPESAQSAGLARVQPVHPPAAYIGGKRLLAKRIVARISATPHTGYAEPFVGMGGIFLRRDMRPSAEFINDWSMDVATFFRILQRHYVAFMDMLRFQLTTRAGFERLAVTDPATLTDLERAARFLYLQRLTFGGKVASRTFGVDRNTPARFDVTKLGSILEAIHERLSSVVIERLPWADFITRYDRPGMLFYLDPPYFGCENDYGRDGTGAPLFDRSQFTKMNILLGQLKGRFILSLNDTPEVRSIFSGFQIEDATTAYSVGGGDRQKPVNELIITGP